MLMQNSPAEVYRKVDFDARIAGCGGRDLVLLCYERFDSALHRAIYSDQRRENSARSTALTQALSALAALQLGIDPANPLAQPLQTMFEAGRRRILASVPAFDQASLAKLRMDFAEIAAAMSHG